ncbi:hypothetical protein OE88DRAFT_1649316, partial [Heliocybe sulcata]
MSALLIPKSEFTDIRCGNVEECSGGAQEVRTRSAGATNWAHQDGVQALLGLLLCLQNEYTLPRPTSDEEADGEESLDWLWGPYTMVKRVLDNPEQWHGVVPDTGEERLGPWYAENHAYRLGSMAADRLHGYCRLPGLIREWCISDGMESKADALWDIFEAFIEEQRARAPELSVHLLERTTGRRPKLKLAVVTQQIRDERHLPLPLAGQYYLKAAGNSCDGREAMELEALLRENGSA